MKKSRSWLKIILFFHFRRTNYSVWTTSSTIRRTTAISWVTVRFTVRRCCRRQKNGTPWKTIGNHWWLVARYVTGFTACSMGVTITTAATYRCERPNLCISICRQIKRRVWFELAVGCRFLCSVLFSTAADEAKQWCLRSKLMRCQRSERV